MISVELNDLTFHAFHGILEEERIVGNTYKVDCKVHVYEGVEIIRHIDQTIDYTIIYAIIKNRMAVPTLLLETICMEIGKDIQDQFTHVKSISIMLKKMQPPIEGFSGSAAVTWHKEF